MNYVKKNGLAAWSVATLVVAMVFMAAFVQAEDLRQTQRRHAPWVMSPADALQPPAAWLQQDTTRRDTTMRDTI